MTLSHKWFLKSSSGKQFLPAGQSLPGNSLPMQETQETQVQSRGQEDPLEEEMATHPGILAWRIPWTDSHVGLAGYSPWGCKRVRHGWATEHHACRVHLEKTTENSLVASAKAQAGNSMTILGPGSGSDWR